MIQLPYAPFSLLVSLIRGAKAALFPSLYEGFGLPVLEAKPVDLSHKSEIDVLAARSEPVYFLLIPPEHWAMNFVMSKCRPPAHTPMAMV
ncbi:glycosyltransferase involved in cell wall biosynthesis [Erythromicrobium ramosum]|uniref:Glycosyltransferase involved in cell wall biosynthesis n=1 Tax=Erythrobacter ramosus TaxID=35811 RepID=A0ABR6HUR8_9SPHN|nr:hypothetical protein [Erythrobacter ramosus]MBB3774408.1 glycosyltransferase involved in cell wall biosynthesis [Erythrobacter ramosus]